MAPTGRTADIPRPGEMSTANFGSVVVFSGGSAANSLVDVFNHVVNTRSCKLSYIIPISDNGGSTSELIRVFGGPVRDLADPVNVARNPIALDGQYPAQPAHRGRIGRLVRLIPDNGPYDPEKHAIKTFFNHRLSSDSQAARLEWLDIVEARHELWKDISSAKKELIRGFLNLLNLEIVKRARPSSVFTFSSASVGNLFLTGARLFSGSLESAIYLLSSICTIPSHVSVLPAINTNFSHHICAGLADGSCIPGQNSISHPSDPVAAPTSSAPGSRDTLSGHLTPYHNNNPALMTPVNGNTPFDFSPSPNLSTPHNETVENADAIEDANLPGSLPTLRKQYIAFSKAPTHPGSDDLPARIERIWYINPYGQEIRPPPNPKIVEATKSAQAIVYSIGSLYTSLAPCLILRGVGTAIREGSAKQKILILNGSLDRETGPAADPYEAIDFVIAVVRAARESQGLTSEVGDEELREYVTHVIYVEGEGTPVVDREVFAAAGIETVRVYGRRMKDGKGCLYDENALAQALSAIIGRHGEKGRRNTVTDLS